MLSELSIIGITLLAAVIAAVAQYVFKRSVPKFEIGARGIHRLVSGKGIWLGGALYLASLVVYFRALASGELSFVYPTFASTFLFVALISHFALGERMGARRMAGMALVVVGITLVALTY